MNAALALLSLYVFVLGLRAFGRQVAGLVRRVRGWVE
jgi:hypothetical protein